MLYTWFRTGCYEIYKYIINTVNYYNIYIRKNNFSSKDISI